MKMHPKVGDWQLMTHGTLNLVIGRSGRHGDTKEFASRMMVMGQKPLAGGTFGLRAMAPLDPLADALGTPYFYYMKKISRFILFLH